MNRFGQILLYLALAAFAFAVIVTTGAMVDGLISDYEASSAKRAALLDP